jgi:phage recombination protein Bet
MQSITTTTNDQVSVWTDEKKLIEIKDLLAPKLTANEFALLVNMGKATGLNPFLREIWAVKYDDKSPAQVFIGRDGYRKVAQSNPDYDYHVVDSVYEKDSFSRESDEVKHAYSLNDRGALVGAYCTVKRKNASKPCFVFVKLNEYSTGKALWATKPETMIKKVAEAQGLRMAFQSLFSGTYDESESWKEKSITVEPTTGEILESVAVPVDEMMKTWSTFARKRYGTGITDKEVEGFLEAALKAHFKKDSLSQLAPEETHAFMRKCNSSN